MSQSALIRWCDGLSRRRLAGGLAIVLLSVAGQCLSGFILDDTLHLARLAATPWPRGLDGVIAPSQLGLYTPSGSQSNTFGYLRPVVGLSMAIDHRLYGLHPFGFHATNVLLHLANVILAWRLARRLGLAAGPAFTAATAWGASLPAGLAAGWISGRSELIATLLVLSALQAVLRHRDGGRPWWLALAALLLLLDCFAKESAFVSPVLILLFLSAAGSPSADVDHTARTRAALQIALWAPLLAALVIRLSVAGPLQAPQPYFQLPDSLAALGVPATKMLVYLAGGLTGMPVVPFVADGALRSHPWAIPLVILILTAGVFMLLRRGPRHAALLLLGWFAVALAPALGVMAFSFYLYLPMLGLCWLLGLAWQNSGSRFLRAWLWWLTGFGVAANLALGACLLRLGHDAGVAQGRFEAMLAADPTRDVVFIDAPFWSYALPVHARLRDPALSCRAHFATFSPSLAPTPPSTTAWTGDDATTLTLLRPGGRYFTSPIERFFLFGNDPCRDGRVGHAVLRSCPCAATAPDTLEVSFMRSVDGLPPLVLQFHGWELRAVAPPFASRQAAPAPE
jgi:hypothetical protein